MADITVADVINKAYTKVNGEYEAQVEGSDDWKTYLNVLNQVMEQWGTTPYVKWQSLFNTDYTLPDLVADDTFQYDFPDQNRVVVANSPLDAVYFVNGTIVVQKYKMVDQAFYQSSSSTTICMLASDGLHIKQVTPDIIGMGIQLPVYLLPPEYTTGAQVVKIDSVTWLVTTMAAFISDASPVPFIARNADKFYKQADIWMKRMRENNRHRQVLSVKKVGDTRFTTLSAAIEAGVGIGGGSFDNLDGGEF